MIEEFERHLRGTNLSENTVTSYLFAVRQFGERHEVVTKRNLKEHKAWLIEQYKPKTVNLRIRAINCYLESIGKDSWKLSSIKVQQKAFLENVISEADYIYFKNCLKRDDNMLWYFVIRFLAATGARVSELVQIKVEHIKLGHSKSLAGRSPFLVGRKTTGQRLYLFESFRRTNHHKRYFWTTEKVGDKVWH